MRHQNRQRPEILGVMLDRALKLFRVSDVLQMYTL
jgi:hypothetical protein